MLRAKPHIDKISVCQHGGINYAELSGRHLDPREILDFSTCCNPYKPPMAIYLATRNVPLEIYPDSDAIELIKALSTALEVNADNLIACSGSTELIRLAALAYLGEGDRVVIPSPTYGEYTLACKLVNARAIKFPLREQNGFRLDISEFIKFARQHEPAAIFLCNPNNPTGQYLDMRAVEKIASVFSSTLIVLDEAYIAFTAGTWNSLNLIGAENLLIVRSMTKDFGLAGLRLGYGVASKSVIDVLRKVRPPWNVNSMAQKAGIAALRQRRFVENSAARLFKSRQYLEKELKHFGFQIIPSQTNFFLVRVGKAREFRDRLLRKGFMVRDCSSFGLPEHIRIGPRSMEDCRRLVRAIREISG